MYTGRRHIDLGLSVPLTCRSCVSVFLFKFLLSFLPGLVELVEAHKLSQATRKRPVGIELIACGACPSADDLLRLHSEHSLKQNMKI